MKGLLCQHLVHLDYSDKKKACDSILGLADALNLYIFEDYVPQSIVRKEAVYPILTISEVKGDIKRITIRDTNEQGGVFDFRIEYMEEYMYPFHTDHTLTPLDKFLKCRKLEKSIFQITQKSLHRLTNIHFKNAKEIKTLNDEGGITVSLSYVIPNHLEFAIGLKLTEYQTDGGRLNRATLEISSVPGIGDLHTIIRDKIDQEINI